MKKLILPTIIFACLIFLAAPFTAYAFLDNLFGNKQGSSEIDCLKEMESVKFWELVHPEWYHDKTKQTITKKDADYCDVAFNAMWEGELRQRDHVRITYFSNKNDAVKKLKSLTSSGKYHLFKSDNNTYLAVGYTGIRIIPIPPGIIREIEYELIAPVYYQVGQVAGNCLFEYKQSQHVGVAPEKDGKSNVQWYVNNLAGIAYEGILNQGEQEIKRNLNGNEVTGITRSVTDILFKDTPLKNLCGSDIQVTQISSKESNTAYLEPKEEGEQVKSSEEISPKQSQSNQTQQQAEQQTQQNTPSQDDNLFNIFAFNPLETWRNIQEILDIEKGFPSLLQSSQFLTLSAEAPLEIPRPSIAFDPEGKPWNFLPGYIPHESIYLGNTMRISEGTKVSAGGVNQGSDKKLLNLEEGEVEVIKNEPEMTDSEYDGIKTPNATVLSIQTHYWVSYDKKKNQTTVAVYEGKIEVKTKDGQTTTMSPDGDPSIDSGQSKPGVVVVNQKLSVTKLAITGVILAAVIGATLFFLKKKKSSNRKH